MFCLLGEKITVVIVASKEDPASINIKNCLFEQQKWEESGTFKGNKVYQIEDIFVVTIEDKKIFHENLDQEIKKELEIEPKLAIFISRHTSKTGEPTLTVHPIGNYGKAEFGGKSRTLVKSSPKIMTDLLRILKKHTRYENLYHKVCFEVTHHGPYLTIPTLFIEVGSTEEEWNKKPPANVVAKSVLDLLKNYRCEDDMPEDIPVIIGIGGGHYAPRFTDMVLENKVAFGHMIPSYQIDAGNIDKKMIEQALNQTPNVKGVYIHRKGLKKPQIREYRTLLEDMGIDSISSKELEDL